MDKLLNIRSLIFLLQSHGLSKNNIESNWYHRVKKFPLLRKKKTNDNLVQRYIFATKFKDKKKTKNDKA